LANRGSKIKEEGKKSFSERKRKNFREKSGGFLLREKKSRV